MMTAHRDPVTIMKAMEQGADGYLAKPFKPQDLIKRIEAILRFPPPSAAPPAKPDDAFILD
jgi:DNA-binding response OmpR family regulator